MCQKKYINKPTFVYTNLVIMLKRNIKLNVIIDTGGRFYHGFTEGISQRVIRRFIVVRLFVMNDDFMRIQCNLGGNKMPKAGKCIYKRKDGRWEGRFIMSRINGISKYKSVYGHTCEEAKNKLIKAKASLEQAAKKTSAGSTEFVGRKWLLETSNNLKESSVNKYESILKNYIFPEFREKDLSDITNVDLIRFCNKLIREGGNKNQGLSSSTVNQIISVMNSLRLYALQRNFTVNYTTECVRIKKDKEETRVFSVEEEQKLVSYLTSHYDLTSLGILLCLFSGLRVGELSALKWDDFDFYAGTFEITKTMQRVKADGQSDKKTVVKIMEPKSKCSIRTIPIPDNLKELLLSARKEGAFLLTGNKYKYVEPRTLQNRFKRILEKAGIEDANFHATRHSYATRCVEQKVETKCLTELLGHSNVSITLNRYVHPSMKLKTKEMAKFTRLFPITVAGNA